MDDKDIRYRLIVTEGGNQIMVKDMPRMSINIFLDNDPVAADHILDITPEEFDELSEKAITNSIEFGTINPSMSNNENLEKELDK